MIRIIQKIKPGGLTAMLFLFASLTASAQLKSFAYRTDVQQIDSSGVYRIVLKPELIAKSRAGLADIRLVDNSGKTQAYALSGTVPAGEADKFIVFPEVKTNTTTDTATVFVAENKNRLNVSELYLKLKKTDVYRAVALSGSDDLVKWFAIEENIPLKQAGAGNETDYEQPVDLPTSDYRYFKIEISGKSKTPVNVLQAGIYTANLNKPVYTALPPLKFSSKDTGKISSIYLDLNEAYQINKLHFTIVSPKYYDRRIRVYAIDKKSAGGEFELADTMLSSSGSQDVLISAKTTRLRVEIYNKDDNPLKIKSIAALQLKQFLVCYLETGHNYHLLTGNTSATKDDYDLSFLNGRVYNQLPGIGHSAVYDNPERSTIRPLIEKNYSLWLWAVIIVALLLLSFLTLKMVREIK